MTFGNFLSVAGLLFVVFALPFILGHLIAGALKVKEDAGRIGVALFALIAGLAPFAWQYVRSGLDQSGYETQLVNTQKQIAAAEKDPDDDLEVPVPGFAIASLTPGNPTTITLKSARNIDVGQRVIVSGVEVAGAEADAEKKEPAGAINGIHRVLKSDGETLTVDVDTSGRKLTAGHVYGMPAPPEPRTWEDAIKLGIDLGGGTNLVYEVEDGALEKAANDAQQSQTAVMERLAGAITRRVNPSGTEEVTVRQVGQDRIEIIMPGAGQDQVDAIKGKIVNLGSLEFAILATDTLAKHRAIIADARKLPDTQRNVYTGDTLVGGWRDIARSPTTGKFKDDLGTGGGIVRREVKIGTETIPQYLCVFESGDARVTGKYLQRARADRDETGRSAVNFTFDPQGGYWFQELTREYAPRAGMDKFHLAVLLNDEIHSAPTLNAVISRNGQITGVEGAEVKELVDVLNAGALEVPLKKAPISEATIGPTLAEDVKQKGLLAIGIAAGVVVVFMLVYYMFAGLVADLCLVLNLVLVMGMMVFIKATFTLPGLAGIVLTIGMAVDANVLIFERIREEMAKGSRLKMAIQNGFGKAFTTIVDANVTTLLTAVVLYMIGTDQVRGFAVTLFIGIVMSMFTALYVGRLVFDIAEKKRWITDLKMLSIVGNNTKWDFLGKRGIAFVVSIIAIVGGMFALTTRGEDNLDIDFSGGVMVSFEFEQGQELNPVRDALQQEFGSGVTLERLVTLEEQQQGAKAKRYRLRLKESDVLGDAQGDAAEVDQNVLENVRKRIATALEAKMPLRLVTLDTIGGIEQIAALDPEAARDDDSAAFAGGSTVELEFSEPIRTATAENYLLHELAKIDDDKYGQAVAMVAIDGKGRAPAPGTGANEAREFAGMTLRVTPEVAEADLDKALKAMQVTMAESPLFDEVNTFSSSVGSEMKWSAAQAMFISLIAIVGYIWFRFEQVTFGLAAVVALVHDVLVVLGMVAVAAYLSGTAIGGFLDLYDFKINLPMIAAFLTIVGYSLNDTIVVFDRIREVRGKNPALTTEMVNTSLNQTLARTLLTSVTTFIVVAILYAIGGEGIHGFAFCLVLGVIVGTYSSIYVASPVLLWLMNRSDKKAAPAG